MIGQLGKVEDLTTCFCLQSAKLPLGPAPQFRHSLFSIADDHRNGGSIGVEDGLKLTGKKLQIAFDLLLPSPAVHRPHVDLKEDREAVPAFQNWSQASERLKGGLQNVGIEAILKAGRMDAEYSARVMGAV